jgi:hypothetical protein
MRWVVAGASTGYFVTERTLQGLYPVARGVPEHSFPLVNLADEDFTAGPRGDSRPVRRLIAVGTHDQLYKGHDDLIRALACADRGLDCTVVRLFNLYGGQDQFSMVARILAAVRRQKALVLINDGNAVRDFVHLDDVLACYRRLLGLRGLPTINIATGKGTLVRNIVDAVRLRGHRLNTTSVLSDEIRISTADVSRLSRSWGSGVSPTSLTTS